jgi:hypothetical protein
MTHQTTYKKSSRWSSYWWFVRPSKVWSPEKQRSSEVPRSEEEQSATWRFWLLFLVVISALGFIGERYVLQQLGLRSKDPLVALAFVAILPLSLYLTNWLGRLIWADLMAAADANNAAALDEAIKRKERMEKGWRM